MSIGPPHSDNPLCKKTQAAESNKGPILEFLKHELPQNAVVLEIGSGTGQHGATFCASLPSISWIPSDISTDHFESIISWGKISEGNRMSTPRCSPFTTAMRVINWVHSNTSNSWSNSSPSLGTSFSQRS